MQYTLSMTTRMLAIAGLCVFLLCVLLFLLGIELGKRMVEPAYPSVPMAASPTGAMPAVPQAPAVPAPPAITVPAAPAGPAIAKP